MREGGKVGREGGVGRTDGERRGRAKRDHGRTGREGEGGEDRAGKTGGGRKEGAGKTGKAGHFFLLLFIKPLLKPLAV